LPLVATNLPPVQYKGEDLDPERGPGLGCFRFQLVVLAVLLVLTPLSVAWRWPAWLSTVLLVVVLVLLLVAGQTVIFLLRLVAADRRSRRRPLASSTRTVGELEDASSGEVASPAIDQAPGDTPGDMPGDTPDDTAGDTPGDTPADTPPTTPGDPPADEGAMRQ
jgi:hypothetical protein